MDGFRRVHANESDAFTGAQQQRIAVETRDEGSWRRILYVCGEGVKANLWHCKNTIFIGSCLCHIHCGEENKIHESKAPWAIHDSPSPKNALRSSGLASHHREAFSMTAEADRERSPEAH